MVNSKLFLLKELPVLFIKIERGFGSFLTFTTKNKSFLWVYLSDWIIYKNKIKILDCEDDYDYSNVLNYMKGELLIKIKENTINKRIDFIFTGGYKLSLSPNTEIYDIEDNLFMFFTKNKIISYSINKGFYSEKG
ncbi:hypothetical protein BSPLISOX_1185 [uncultured Gammaproteobacteria bacterium]|jgi:hypothetical protein|nr:hypothetical protein [uncultured Gammaproteobacteria bacterium]CAC9478795.1 hypothetical protein [uncultured Gammaproteobacteria bacterium]VVH67422.1 hypothetical protein BSPLISOX_1185 [uncultured Gammaproteobacteria bacterium]